MTKFQFTARDEAGQPVSGFIEAETQGEATRMLRNDGKFVVSIAPRRLGRLGDRVAVPDPAAPAPAETKSPGYRPRVDPNDVRAFANQLAVMLDTGVSLAEALETCVDPKNSAAFTIVLDDIIAQIQAGNTFSAALARHPQAFTPMFINMVRASEASGRLGPMLRRVADFITSQRDLSRKVTGAVIYPAVMLTLSLGVVIFLVVFVLPKFAKIYAGREELLPAISRFMMGISGYFTAYGPYAAGLIIATVIGAAVWFRRPDGKLVWDRIKLAIPLFGGLFHKTYVARSLRTLGTLLQSGVAMLEAIELTRASVGNSVYQNLWAGIHDQLQQGKQLSELLRENKLIPRTINKMVEAGERSGRLGNVLETVADHCEGEVATDVKAITSLIEPVIVIFLGGIVGTVVVALLLPIFTVSRAMRPQMH
jgi:type II secretory pathway component PulF